MRSECLDEDALLRLADGELTENAASGARDHIAACAVCRARSAEIERTLGALRAPFPTDDAAIDDVMRKLPTAVADPAALPRKNRAPRWIVGVTIVAAAAAAIVIAPRFVARDDGFQARGGHAEMTIARGVGVDVQRVGDGALASGARVRAKDAYAISYTNLMSEPAYLLAFAVDAKSTVHWVSPAYTDPATNPASFTLSPSTQPAIAGTGVELDAPALGAMRFVAVVSKSPLHVRDVDELRAAELETRALAARFAGADVRELVTVNVAP